MLSKLLPIFNARQMKKVDTEYTPTVRQFLELRANAGNHEPLIDGEHGIVARLGKTSQTITDCRPLSDAQIMALKDLGLLSVNWQGFDTFRKAAPTVMLDSIATTPGVRTVSEGSSLHVEAMK